MRHSGRVIARIAQVGLSLLALALGMEPVTLAAPHAPRSCSAAGFGSATEAPAKAASGARISLDRSSGTVGTEVIVSGAGWPAGAQVFIHVEDLVIEAGYTDSPPGQYPGPSVAADGTFTSAAFAFPSGVCGRPPLDGTTAQVVAATTDQSVTARASFHIVQVPSLAVSIAGAPLPGGVIPANVSVLQVAGSQWAPGTVVTLIAGSQVLSTVANHVQPFPGARPVSATADTQGAFTADVSLPAGLPPGTSVDIGARVTSGVYGTLNMDLNLNAALLPSAEPTLALDHAQGQPGIRLVVKGTHWRPGDTVIIEYCRNSALVPDALGVYCSTSPTVGAAQELQRASVDAVGTFATEIVLPIQAKAGPITIQARIEPDAIGAPIYRQARPFTLTRFDPTTPWWVYMFATVAALLLLAATMLLLYRWRGRQAARPSAAAGAD